MFPIALNHAARILPRHLVNGVIGWMSACGAGGSSLLPFAIGTMAAQFGIQSLQPLCQAAYSNGPNAFRHPRVFYRVLTLMIILGTLTVMQASR